MIKYGKLLAVKMKAGTKMEEVKIGKYKHFKGNEYEVLYLAKHSETCEPLVVYRALYGEREVWVRPLSMWNEKVERDGKIYQRFTLIE
jgi:hypothetical protein